MARFSMHQNDANPPRYTALQRRLHLLVLLVVASQYLFQGPMRRALAQIESGADLTFAGFLVTTVHTLGGALIAAAMLWRWQLARQNPVPVAADRMSDRASCYIRIHHQLFYAMVLIMAISGALHYYLGWRVAGRWHELGKWGLAVLIVVHVAGAVWHVLTGHREVFSRMMGRARSR